jgi:ABC-type nitrate/sulfonate/bicarbonate transport system ATPase subunit
MSVQIANLMKAYAGQPVISGLNLELPEQGIIGLMGPSGCGKTTLLRLLAGLAEPDGGTISGIDRRQVSMVFQEDRLLPWLSAQENLAAVLSGQQEAAEWLDKVLLADYAHYYPAEMSGGMKRRVALARGLAFPSRLLLLDEPFQGVDTECRQVLHSLVRSSAKDRLVILVTHDAADLATLADRVLLAAGPPLTLI